MTAKSHVAVARTLLRACLAARAGFRPCAAAGIVAVVSLQAGLSRAAAAASPCPVAGDADIANALKSVRQKHNVPAMAGAIVTSRGIAAVAAVGVRKKGTDIAVTLDDKWHLGSDTKAMTATLVARLVERGRLRWDTTVADVFPDLSATFHPDMKGVTLLHLLSHRAGLPANLELRRFLGQAAPQERLRAVKEHLAKSPKEKPGSKTEYSNLGYIIVGAVVEQVTGESWEESIRDEVFAPLAMATVGFGGMGTPGQVDQPWGHTDNGKPVKRNGPKIDNPPVMGPAGRVHCTMQDWARFISDQLRGARDGPALLQNATYNTLHTPPFGGAYALGWIVTEREWGGGTVLTHGGCNTMNFANTWVAPERDFAILVCVNQGGNTAAKASDEAVSALIRLVPATTKSNEEAQDRE